MVKKSNIKCIYKQLHVIVKILFLKYIIEGDKSGTSLQAVIPPPIF